jgi:hypothetical protein
VLVPERNPPTNAATHFLLPRSPPSSGNNPAQVDATVSAEVEACVKQVLAKFGGKWVEPGAGRFCFFFCNWKEQALLALYRKKAELP